MGIYEPLEVDVWCAMRDEEGKLLTTTAANLSVRQLAEAQFVTHRRHLSLTLMAYYYGSNLEERNI